MCRALAVSFFLIIWTRIDYGLTTDASAVPGIQGNDLVNTSGFGGDPLIDGINQDLAEEKENVDPIVRNFLPVKGKQRWMRREFPPLTEMLFFNVSVVGDNEEVTLAQLHLHRRRLAKTHINYHRRFLPSPYRVVLWQIQPNYRHKVYEDARTMKLASLPVSHMTKGGWHTLDVTPVIRELLINAQGPIELLFGVQFEAPKKSDNVDSPLVPLKHFLKNPNTYSSEHPYKTSSYLVIFSELDPYFEDFEDEDFLSTNNYIPTSDQPKLKQRHLKHKIFKENEKSETNHIDGGTTYAKQNKAFWKYKNTENEVIKTGKKEMMRHKSKHRGNEVKRSKADELALKEKTKLKSLPFLHANEVEEIRQTSRRLTRSSTVHRKQEKSKYATPDSNSPSKDGSVSEKR